MIKIYQYPKCSSCKNAIKFLNSNNIKYQSINITESTPSKREIKKMLKYLDGNIKKLFNTSGKIYRDLGLSKKIDAMDEQYLIKFLSEEGMLIKRPFLITDKIGLTGFKESIWLKALDIS